MNIFLDLSIKDCMFITSKTENFEGCLIAKFVRIWAYTHAWGSLTIGDGWSSTSFPSIGSLFKSKPEWIFLPHAKSTNSTTLYYALTKKLSCQLHIFFSLQFSIFTIQRGMRLAKSFVASFILNFSHSPSMAKSTLQSTCKNLDIL